MKSSALILILIFSAVFMFMIASIPDFITLEFQVTERLKAQESAMNISEAGINYYVWHLAHYPDDLQDGAGTQGPYIHNINDPQAGLIGNYSLDISGNIECNNINSVEIKSTGSTIQFPNEKRTIKAIYSRPSVAQFTYIINDNVWAGSDRIIKGPYHSNGGIRMDGENNALVTSAKETWNCTTSFGCNYPYEIKPGIFGQGIGGEQGLWKFPTEIIDFNAITMDLAQLKTLAQSSGIYFDKSENIGYTNGKGYHLILKENGTIDVYVITKLNKVYAYNSEQGYYWDYQIINTETFYQNIVPQSSCGVLFFEDNLWIQGKLDGKITIASANLIDSDIDTNVILNSNIEYKDSDGSDGLTLISEKNIKIPLYSPDNMELFGIFIAQKGNFGRDHYKSNYNPWHKRSKLEITGSIISNKRVGTKWICGGTYCSGYNERENSYDSKLTINPPPLTPFSDDEYKIIKWEEIN